MLKAESRKHQSVEYNNRNYKTTTHAYTRMTNLQTYIHFNETITGLTRKDQSSTSTIFMEVDFLLPLYYGGVGGGVRFILFSILRQITTEVIYSYISNLVLLLNKSNILLYLYILLGLPDEHTHTHRNVHAHTSKHTSTRGPKACR